MCIMNLEYHVSLNNKNTIKDKPVVLKRLMRQLEETYTSQRLNYLGISGDANCSPGVENIKKHLVNIGECKVTNFII